MEAESPKSKPQDTWESVRADLERAIRECYPDRASVMLLELDRATRRYSNSIREERRAFLAMEMEWRLEQESSALRVTERAYSKAMRELARAVAKPKPRRLSYGGRIDRGGIDGSTHVRSRRRR